MKTLRISFSDGSSKTIDVGNGGYLLWAFDDKIKVGVVCKHFVKNGVFVEWGKNGNFYYKPGHTITGITFSK